MGWFITNYEWNRLSEIINLTLPKTEYLKFLVWYFYFSWFEELYKKIWDKPMTVIIWMDVESRITKYIAEWYKDLKGKSFDNIQSHTVENIENWYNSDPNADTYETNEAVKVFIEKIKNGTLKIYRTIEPNHSKVYIFKYVVNETTREWRDYWTMILWSSNLTRSWLYNRFEFNAELSDERDVKEWEKLFDELLEQSVLVTEWWEDDPIVKMFENNTRVKIPLPYYCYLKVLHEYFSADSRDVKMPSEITENWVRQFKDFSYQTDAIIDALDMIEIHNWVLVADVVWMWKTIIWATLLKNLQQKSLIICKPHLMLQWKKYAEDFWLNVNMSAAIESSWNLEKIVKDLEKETNNDYRTKVVLIDEAHKFRNWFTKDYARLKKICQWKKVILLTATPYNNQPDDVFNLIKLFQIPKKPTVVRMNSLNADFQELQRRYVRFTNIVRDKARPKADREIDPEIAKKELKKVAEEIRELIRPFTIRRTRKDLENNPKYLEDMKNQGFKDFSKIADPVDMNYDLWEIEDEYIKTLDELLEKYDNLKWWEVNKLKKRKFKCARYTPLLYLKWDKEKEKYEDKFFETYWYDFKFLQWRQLNMPLFITRQLVSRFESSIYSFMISLNHFIKTYEDYIGYVEKNNVVPVISWWVLDKLIKMWWVYENNKWKNDDEDDEVIMDENDDNEEEINENIMRKENLQEFMQNSKCMFVDINDLDDDFVDCLKSDLKYLKALKERWSKIYWEDWDHKEDNKYSELKKIIEAMMKKKWLEWEKRKVVIFSQFADTTKYLFDKLYQDFDWRVIRITGDVKTAKEISKIERNFDASAKEQDDDFDIIVATDSISEWVNLHRAWVIINYDIPWNPTVIVQRVGRINRIDKTLFKELYIYNAFPSLVGKEIFQVQQVVTIKNNMLSTIFWADTKILSWNDTIWSYFGKILKESEEQDEEDPMMWYRSFYEDLRKRHDKDLEEAIKLPVKSKVQRWKDKLKWSEDISMIVFWKKWKVCIFKAYNPETKEIKNIELLTWMRIFEADITEKGKEITEDWFKNIYPELLKSLFINDSEWETDKKSRKALVNMQVYRKDFLAINEEYYKYLEKCITELWSISPRHLRMIRNITQDNKENKIKEIMEELPLYDLKEMIKIGNNIDSQWETIVLAEEFI